MILTLFTTPMNPHIHIANKNTAVNQQRDRVIVFVFFSKITICGHQWPLQPETEEAGKENELMDGWKNSYKREVYLLPVKKKQNLASVILALSFNVIIICVS